MPPPVPVLVCLVGPFRVERAGTPVSPAALGSRKARTLLRLLASRPGQPVSGREVAAALWPTAPPGDPDAVIASLVSRLRASLGPAAIEGGRGQYRLGAGVEVDLRRARSLIEDGRRHLVASPALAGTAGQAALAALAGGEALADEPDAHWVGSVRGEVRGLRRQARQLLAQAALATGEADLAERAAGAAVADDAADEVAVRLLMRALLARGQAGEALRAYEGLRRHLADELGVDPAPATRELHIAALRGRPPAEPAGTPGPAEDSPVGRDAESELLRSAWTQAAGGQASIVVVAGEAGIGKTTLLASLVDLAGRTGGTVLSARCFEAEQSLFAQPFVDALRAAAGQLATDRLRRSAAGYEDVLTRLVPDLAAVVGQAPALRRNPATEQEHAFAAVTGFLRGLAADAPLLLALDDLHHAGRSTLELIHYASRRLGRDRVLLAAALRAEEGRDALAVLGSQARLVLLGPLSLDAVTQLAARLGQQPRAGEIARRTGGHPLFVVETLRALAAGGSGLPESVQAAILERVARVGADAERLLRAGAVLGSAFAPSTAAALVGAAEADALPLLERGLEARLLATSGAEYAFAHDVVREALIATTPSPTRLAWHARAADLLSAEPEAVAQHAEAVGDTARAGRAWLRAAEQALGRFAAADARALATSAAAAAVAVDDAELEGRALVVRGRAHDVGEGYAAALRDYTDARRCARRAGDRRLEMITLRELAGDVPVALGYPPSQCEPPLMECLGLAESLGDRGMQADVLDRLTILACAGMRFRDAAGLADRAVAAGRAANDSAALAAGLDASKTVHAYLGDVATLAVIVEELEPLQRRLGNLWALQWAVLESAFIPLAEGDYEAALARMDTALQVCRRSGYTSSQSFFIAHQGWAHRLAGRLDAALDCGRRAVQLGAQHRHAWWFPTAAALLAGTLLETGQAREAETVLRPAVPAASVPGAEAYALRCLALLAQASGSADILVRAEDLLARLQLPDGRAWLLGADAYLGLARAWRAAGEGARAAAVLAPMRAAAQAAGWPALVRLADAAG